jgi:hypothetical protein
MASESTTQSSGLDLAEVFSSPLEPRRPPRTTQAVRVVVIARREGAGWAFLCRRRDLFGQIQAGAAIPPTAWATHSAAFPFGPA